MPNAIVTGGSKGFGRALAADLVREGWTVIIDGRDHAALNDVATALGDAVRPIAGDVTDGAHRSALLDEAARSGGLDLLVNNAGSLGPTPLPRLADLSANELTSLFVVNVVAPLSLAQLALPLLRAEHGAIVNVTSDAAVEAYEGWGAYGTSKAALEQLSNVLSVEEPDVRVWWLDPGDMRTAMHQAAFPGEDISDRPSPEDASPCVVRLLRERPPSGRVRARDLLEAAP